MNAQAPIVPAVETELKAALKAYMAEFGFTQLRVTYTRLENEIAREHRLELFLEGWVA